MINRIPNQKIIKTLRSFLRYIVYYRNGFHPTPWGHVFLFSIHRSSFVTVAPEVIFKYPRANFMHTGSCAISAPEVFLKYSRVNFRHTSSFAISAPEVVWVGPRVNHAPETILEYPRVRVLSICVFTKTAPEIILVGSRGKIVAEVIKGSSVNLAHKNIPAFAAPEIIFEYSCVYF